MVTAYSYVRFSSKKQADGDSLRRQTEAAAAYCERRKWVLSTQTYRDLGVSGWKGRNSTVGNLGEFLKAVKSGAVKPGSVLIVESFDRLTRQGIDEGYDVIKGILKAGVLIVTLTPEREFDESATRSLSKGALEIQLILERAAEESERKSERCGAAWGRKKREASRGKAITRRVPAWLRVEGGQIVCDDPKVEIVRQVYRWTVEGYGLGAIAKRLNVEGVPPITRGQHWARSYLARLLTDRSVLGEYQPHTRRGDGRRRPDGKPVPDYYPRIVDEELYDRARTAAIGRRKKEGRPPTGLVNVFTGLLKDARDGGGVHMFNNNRQPVLASHKAVSGVGGAKYVSFPMHPFEVAILHRLKELEPASVVPEEGGSVARVEALEGRLKSAEKRLKVARERFEADPESPTWADLVTPYSRCARTPSPRNRG